MLNHCFIIVHQVIYIYMYICFINFLLFCQLVIIFVNCYQLFFNCLSTGLSNVYQLVICFIVLSYCYQLLPTVYQLFINFLSTFINFLSTFINFLSTFYQLNCPPPQLKAHCAQSYLCLLRCHFGHQSERPVYIVYPICCSLALCQDAQEPMAEWKELSLTLFWYPHFPPQHMPRSSAHHLSFFGVELG